MESMHLILIGILVLHPKIDALEKLDDPELWGPFVALEKSVVAFYCEIREKPATLSVQYELYVETNPGKIIGEYSSLSGELATFSLFTSKQHNGRLICKASGHNDTDIESSVSEGLDFRVIVPVTQASIVTHPSIEDLWEGQSLTLQCTTNKGTYVSIDWFWNDAPVRRNEDTLTIHGLSALNTGLYMCVASNQFNETAIFNSSSAVSVFINEYVSEPEISFDVVKRDDGGYKAIITCQFNKGTPLYTFSLLNHTDLITSKTTNDTRVSFNMPVELNRHMGRIRCNASNEGNWVLSDPVSLIVESVGGAVTMTAVKHVGLDFQVIGVVLRCEVERGTFPHYSWFLNNSRLLGRGGFYAVSWSDESILALSVGQDGAGFYHCQASDRFGTSIRSTKMLISKEELNTVSPLVVMVVFTCFALLNAAVIACCVYGLVLRRRYSRKYPLDEQRRKMRIVDKQEDDEDDKMSESYEEDVVRADRLSDSSEHEDQSVDESVLYEGTVSE